ncbi:hypothetical protein R1sor_014367 [Riccia sorocarpa]|uniref:Cell differentiation protein rcd1 n=1 Tax=Riccia sorocarpa TaxID=122646 RepID=A0ABD3H9Q1_9MARC
MAPFDLERVKYSDYVLAPTSRTVRIPGLVILPEEWEVWDAVGIQVTPPVERNLDDIVCYARAETNERRIQNEGKLLQGPARKVTTVVDDATDCEDEDFEVAWEGVEDIDRIRFNELGVESEEANAQTPDPQDESGKIVTLLTSPLVSKRFAVLLIGLLLTFVEADISERTRKRGGRRHKGHFMKRPMALAEVIEELKHPELRENALRCLSGHLIEKREVDMDFYRQAGYFLYHSSGTVAVLLQEILSVYNTFNCKDLKVRASKRLSNVITLLQTIAANEETRWPLVKAGIPNYLRPFIMATYTEEVYENIRCLSLSVINILCQTHETRIIEWAIESEVIPACIFVLETGSELSKVLGMAIMESIFHTSVGVSAVCDVNERLLPRFFKVSGDLVSTLSQVHGLSPRLLFVIVRVYILLCQNRRALEILSHVLPRVLQDSTFDDLRKEYPTFNYLIHQLLLFTGKAVHRMPRTPHLLKRSDAGPSVSPTPPAGQWNLMSRRSLP